MSWTTLISGTSRICSTICNCGISNVGFFLCCNWYINNSVNGLQLWGLDCRACCVQYVDGELEQLGRGIQYQALRYHVGMFVCFNGCVHVFNGSHLSPRAVVIKCRASLEDRCALYGRRHGGDMVCHSSQKRKRKKASLKFVQIESITSNMKLQPSPASPSPSEVYFCSHCTCHKETYLNLPIYNINLGFISSHFFESLVKQSMGLCQGLPLEGLISKFCKDHLVMQFAGYLLEFMFNDFEHPNHRCHICLIVQPQIDKRLGRPIPMLLSWFGPSQRTCEIHSALS